MMSRIKFVPIIVFSIMSTGCAPLVLVMIAAPIVTICLVMNNATDNVIRLEKATQEIESEKRKDVRSIEGVFKSSEMKVVQEAVPSSVGKDGRRTPSIPERRAWCVTFEDGRSKSFSDMPSKPIKVGSYYIIQFNGVKRPLG